MQLGDRKRRREPEPDPLLAARAVATAHEEALEQSRTVGIRDPRSSIGHAPAHDSLPHRDRHGDLGVVRREPLGVRDEVEERLLEPAVIAEERDRLVAAMQRDALPAGVGQRRDRRDDTFGKLARVEAPKLEPDRA